MSKPRVAGLILGLSLLGCAATHQPDQEYEVTKDQITSMTVEQVSDAPSKNGLLMVTTSFEGGGGRFGGGGDTGTWRAPKAFVVRANEQEFLVRDDGTEGDAAAGDGVYTSRCTTIIPRQPGQPARVSKVLTTNPNIHPRINGEAVPMNSYIDITTVDCPSGCKGFLFGGPCRVCVRIHIHLEA